MADSFDDLSTDGKKKNDKPFWAIDLKDEKAVLQWLNAEIEHLEKENEDRLRDIKHNLARYKGIQYQTQDTRSGNRDREQERAKFSPKLVVNLLSQATEQRVSQLMKFRPGVQVLPTNDEYQDKVSSKIAKQCLDHIDYTRRYEAKNQMCVRISEITGEGYLDYPWNEDLGGNHPDSPDDDEEIPLLDEEGNEQKDEKGEVIKVAGAVKIGDVDVKVLLPVNVFLQKKDSYDESGYAFIRERVETEELKRENPKLASKIKADSDASFYNIAKLEDEKLQHETVKWTFQFKPCKYMPKGRWITFTKDAILENQDFKYDHGDFSFERLPCKEIPGEMHAVSFYQDIKGLSAQYSNLTNMIIRNQALVAHPKWFVPKGSVKLESLGNDITIAQYQGSQPPVLAQQNPTPREVFEFRENLKNEIRQLSGLGDVTSGEPPPGIKAGVALQFLAEQEAQIANARIANYNEFQRRSAEKKLKVAGQFYDKSDKRTMLVLGQNKSWIATNFSPEHLSRSFDIRIQNSSALPDSKAARTQYILDMAERFPNMFPQEQVVEMLDMGQSEKFMDEAASAARAAEYENEKILNNEQVEAPEIWEDCIVHWKIHVKAMQDPSFKSKKTPDSVRQTMKDHVMATEMLIVQAAETNMGLQQVLQTMPNFPMFFTMAPPPPPPPQGDPNAPMDPAQPPPMDEAPMMPGEGMIPSDMQPPEQVPQDMMPETPVPTGEPMPGLLG
jgi:hypothetical protein